ncbi:MAG: UbiX family flavin prenyltransferase [Planctomycetota bacterium]|jgi:4-hydroxy-3-polyprenylbenzoate decarboxylase
MKRRFVVALTGASGAAYAIRLVDVLVAAGCDVYLSISEAGRTVLEQDLDLSVDLDRFEPAMLLLDRGSDADDAKLQNVRAMAGIASEESNVLSVSSGEPGEIRYYHHGDLTAPIASGSFLTDGMVICPCSMATLGAVAHATGTNLIHRAADVHVKERRKLILVPRETPLSVLHLENMKRAAEAGAVVLPAMPGFYHQVTAVHDLIDFLVARICDQLKIPNDLIRRWGYDPEG